MKQISDNEIYLLIKYIKSVLWRVAKRLSYIEEARCLKVKVTVIMAYIVLQFFVRGVYCGAMVAIERNNIVVDLTTYEQR